MMRKRRRKRKRTYLLPQGCTEPLESSEEVPLGPRPWQAATRAQQEAPASCLACGTAQPRRGLELGHLIPGQPLLWLPGGHRYLVQLDIRGTWEGERAEGGSLHTEAGIRLGRGHQARP